MKLERRIDIEDGGICFGKAAFAAMIQKAPDGAYIIGLEPYSEDKTYRQIKFFHGPLVDVYSDYTGESPDDAKFNLKKRYGVNQLVRDSQNGKVEQKVRSLGDYTKEQMQTFLERVLHHLEFECNFIIDAATRKKFKIDITTGELVET